MPHQPLRLCPLPALGFLSATGADAESFLNAQLSQEVRRLEPQETRLAAWHDARGRVQALVRVLRSDSDEWLLLTPAESLADLVTRMGVFVLRADVRLEKAGGRWRGAALIGQADIWLDQQGVSLGKRPGDALHRGALIWIRVGPELLQVIGPPEVMADVAPDLTSGTEVQAELAGIRLGLPEITPVLRERFLPQMLNLDWLGALAFDKGCYPGQEVIARTQNLGSVKRRLHRFSAARSNPPAVGAEVLNESGTPVGVIVRAAQAQERVELLAVIQLNARKGVLVCKDDPGSPLRLEPLPYEGGDPRGIAPP